MQQAGGAWRWERYTRASSAASGIEVGNAILLQKSQECRPLYFLKSTWYYRSTYY